ncbi:DNA mismatch repair endonuclease MutL [Pseudoflavonifractor sp. 524-17]|uniref:DNA mismatch repair endonuclease MutL n=1 Tax=Pseudoflavonifractor sp. 524-17 TaxID=2304577 RepID=UPI00137A6BBC|nr:DNA mismatch repair endonuclease MutL [Pseudoflavonifractor sp. 524-17]NCE63627.1 DNA mismatch repair endonuclease MutL [Pseudoflavonifractor sp. 524-17]
MPRIHPLPPHVADLIAAGEVVERPASVAKELIENAIDAGASHVTVEIQHGGMSLLRVTDNGCGIPGEEAETAFLRHATSKVQTEQDLEAIGTLGFRGEALAAIAAVSRISLLTRTAEEAAGTALELEGGVMTGREEAGCPQGTTMLVRDLFYNTPARLKFMKKDAAEGAAVFAAVQHLALSHPEVSIRFLRDGRQELHTPGDSRLESAVYAVLGRDIALGMVPVKSSGGGLTVEGYVSLPACCRGTRGCQHFFVNGRFVKSRTMTAALEEAYANQRMVGKFPGCVLHLTARLNTVDVNVHPTKQEVKFSSERNIFDGVYYAVRSALGADRTRPAVRLEEAPAQARPARPAPEIQETQAVPPAKRPSLGLCPRSNPAQGGRLSLHDAARPVAPALRPQEASEPDPAPAPRPERTSTPPPPSSEPQREPPPEPPAPAEPLPWRLAGEVFQTYILVEQGDAVFLIDKHAAHERIHFDRLKAEGAAPMSQVLLTPAVFTPPPEEGAILLQHLDLLAQFGFVAEDFGGGALIVRQCPDYIDAGEAEGVLCQLAAQLSAGGRADPAAARDALLHTMACKAAVKGGQKNSPAELEKVAQAVMSGEVKYCPHGRPVAITLTRAQLERQFKRT